MIYSYRGEGRKKYYVSQSLVHFGSHDRKCEWQVGSGAVHLDVGQEVGVKPVHGEAQVVGGGGEEMETTSVVQVLQAQQVLE